MSPLGFTVCHQLEMRWYYIFVIPRENRDRTTKHGCRPPRGESCRWRLTQHSPRNQVQNTWAERGTCPTAQPTWLYFNCLFPIFQTHKGRCLFCWLLDTQVLNKYLWKTEKNGKKGSGEKLSSGVLSPELCTSCSLWPCSREPTKRKKAIGTQIPDKLNMQPLWFWKESVTNSLVSVLKEKTSIFQVR